MVARYIPSGFYDEETIKTLEQAFREIWKAVSMHDAINDIVTDDMRRRVIAETMMKLASGGVSSVDELRDRTLRELALEPLPTTPSRPQRRRSPRAA